MMSSSVGMRVSACLIVRNESAHLGACLTSIQSVVDEIIVVDTGSTDDTVAIAQSYGAQVHHFPWCDDFAAARNHSLQFATGDWLLIIDADEYLTLESQSRFPAFLKAIAQETRQVVFNFRVLASGEQPILTRAFFRNHQGAQFVGRVHEWPAINGKRLPGIACPGLALEHAPILATPKALKQGYYRQLILKTLQEPLSPYDRSMYFKHLAQVETNPNTIHQAYQSALSAFIDSQSPLHDPHHLNILVPLIRHTLLVNSNVSQALVLCQALTTAFPHFPEGWMYQGYTQFWLGHLDEAAEAYHQALQLLQDANVPQPVQQRTHHISRLGLARIDLLQNRIAPGIATLSTLYTHNPSPELACHLAHAFVLGQDMSQALSYWEKARQPACENPTDLVASLRALDIWSPLERLSFTELS